MDMRVRPITCLTDALDALGTQEDVGLLYDPPISQQAVGEWLKRNMVPVRRVPRIVKILRSRGYQIKPEVLNDHFEGMDLTQ